MQIEVKQLVLSFGITAIFVTHDQEEAIRMSDRIAVMRQGRVVQCDTPDAVYDRPADLFVAEFMGASNLLDAKVIGGGSAGLRLHAAGSEIHLGPDSGAAGGPDGVLMVRPENLDLVPEAPPDGAAWKG